VLLNLRWDHKPTEELVEMFTLFRERTRGPFLVSEDRNLRRFHSGATVFGLGPECHVRAENVEIFPDGSAFSVSGTVFRLGLPGEYNVANALAAIAVCRAVGIDLAEMVKPLGAFPGVARRFQWTGTVNNIEVVDDFAHNPDKIQASLQSARACPGPRQGGRVLAVFQPHGFGPTRFLKDGLVEAFARCLRPQDRLWMPEIYYAGGTVSRDISSRDITDAVCAQGKRAKFLPSRADILSAVTAAAQPGDLILVMGARDPSLTDFCHAILEVLGKVSS
jgi:UDP-N-acetylmuramate--alanine ligase